MTKMNKNNFGTNDKGGQGYQGGMDGQEYQAGQSGMGSQGSQGSQGHHDGQGGKGGQEYQAGQSGMGGHGSQGGHGHQSGQDGAGGSMDHMKLSKCFQEAHQKGEKYLGLKLDNEQIMFVDMETENLQDQLESKDGCMCCKHSGAKVVDAASGNDKETIKEKLNHKMSGTF